MEQAIHAEVWQVRQMLAGERIPRPEPPQPGWREDAAKKQAEVDRRMARYTG